MLVDAALYRDGTRVGTGPISDLASRGSRTDEFVWVGLHDPTPGELAEVAEVFDLHPLAVEDAHTADQQPKVERFGDSLFIVLRTARYLDEVEQVQFGEVEIFASARYVVVIRHGEPVPLAPVRTELEQDPALLAVGPVAVVHAVLDAVVDRYEEVLSGLDNDVTEVELEVFSGRTGGSAAGRGNPVERIYFLRREVLELHRAMHPLSTAMPTLRRDPLVSRSVEFDEYFRDVVDHLARQADQLAILRELLADALSANATQVNLRQNADMRKISAWVAIAAVPTMVAGVYGMNFEHMPELDSMYGYPTILVLTGSVCFALHRRFRRAGWL